MTLRELPSFLHDLLAAPPRAGEGVHAWLFRVARQLHAHLPAGEIFALLKSLVANCGRYVSDAEIWDAIRNSLACAWQPSGKATSQQSGGKWPKADLERLEAICAEGYGLADFWERSPVPLENNQPHTEQIIVRLFPGNPLLCVGRYIPNADGATEHYTRPRDEWRDLEQWELIVPSPMSAPTGLTKEGKASAHTLDNTGLRRFLVVECDFSIYARDGKNETSFAPLIRKLDARGFSVADICAAVLLHLAGYAPLVCADHSGGKSIHGWYYVQGQPEDRLCRFMRYAVSLGADRATWGRSQFVRMPDGTRGNGQRQTVYFLNFKALEASR